MKAGNNYLDQFENNQNNFEEKGFLEDTLQNKKFYSVTSDEARRRFITVWNSGNKTIKEVSN